MWPFPSFPVVAALLLYAGAVAADEKPEKDEGASCFACVESKRDCLNTGNCGSCREGYVEVGSTCIRPGNPVSDPRYSRRDAISSAATVPMPATLPTTRVSSPSRGEDDASVERVYLIVVVVCSCLIAVMGIAIAYLCWAKLRAQVRSTNEAEYSYKQVEGDDNDGGDKINGYTSAQRAQLYMYNQKRQQIKSMNYNLSPARLSDYHSEEGSGSIASPQNFNSSDLQPGEDDDTIYECPGPSNVGDTKIINPVYQPRRMSSAKRQSTATTNESSSLTSPASN